MIRANGGICILLHMSLPNGRPHAAEMMTITEHGAQANCCANTDARRLGPASILRGGEQKWGGGGKEERSHRDCLKKGGASLKNLRGYWTNLLSVLFNADQSDLFTTSGATW